MSDYYSSEEFREKAKAFRKFTFRMRFNKARIASVARDEQVERSVSFLKTIGGLSPILKDWYLCGDSPESAKRFNVVDSPEYLHKEVMDWVNDQDGDMSRATQYSLWNGEENIFKGGLSLSYFAHDIEMMPAYIEFEDAGALVMALPDVKDVLVGIMSAAVEFWPEIEWGVVAPEDYYLKYRVFTDRLTAGWIGYCPYPLKNADFSSAAEVVDIPGRGSIIVSSSEVMNEKNREHYERVGDIDKKLVELGYLPMFRH